jgi:energy-coupling factor transport system ATP-binding protein
MGISIYFDDLSFTYSRAKNPALRNINAEIEEGKFVFIMGHEGAGKSTICYSLNGIVPRMFRGNYLGRVLIDGEEVSKKKIPEMSKIVGLVLQDFEAQLFSTNVELEMAFGPENHCLPRSEIERRIHNYLNFVGLANFRHREPSSLSGGQKQRLAIGSILALEPKILAMDEPTTDLDPKGRMEILSVADIIRQQEKTLLIVDHESEGAIDADEVWLMKEGQLVAKGPPDNILTDLEKMELCGIRPPSILKLFRLMNWPGSPLTFEQAISLINKHDLLKPERLKALPEIYTKSSTFPLLRVEGLKYIYPFHQVEALRDINLSIYEGEFIAVLGQNGSGKTTLVKHFNSLLKPTAGEIFLQGKSLKDLPRREIARLVGYVFQNPDHQLFARTVREEVGFALKMFGESPKKIEDCVAEALEVVGLIGYEDKVPFALTKGERQRIAVASVLATKPLLIILDEPTTGLDFLHQRNMMEMLKRLNRMGHTIIIITHSLWVAAEYADRIIVMKDGEIIMDGPTRAIFYNEEKLMGASLIPPPIIRLSNWLGTKSLKAEDMVKELKEKLFINKEIL